MVVVPGIVFESWIIVKREREFKLPLPCPPERIDTIKRGITTESKPYNRIFLGTRARSSSTQIAILHLLLL